MDSLIKGKNKLNKYYMIYNLPLPPSLLSLQAALQFRSLLSDDEINKIQLVSSDFLRTRQTAEILHSELQLKRPIKFEPRIRERGLGSLELGPVSSVHEMWKNDEMDPTAANNGVESVSSMTLRLTRVIKDYDTGCEDLVIVLVSHGDPCQCLHSFFIGLPPNEFRASGRGYGNCEIRELIDK